MSVGKHTGLPKAELHVHLEGTLEPELLMELARRNHVEVPWASADELRQAYSFTGLEHFLALYFKGCEVLRTRRDFHDLALAYLERAAAQSVLHTEIYFGPQGFLDTGVQVAEQLGGIFDAFAEARERWGIDAGLIVSAHRHRSEADALEMLELVAPWFEDILAFGLGSAELGNPPSKFAAYFQACRRKGFPLTIHAGEEGPPDYIRQALDIGRADRIDHGVTAIRDTDLVKRLVDEQVPLTMCPLSNLRLQVVQDLTRHPLRALMDGGVLVTVNSDDPSYFGGYINENYAAIAEALGLDDDAVTTLAKNSFTASFATDSTKKAWIQSVNEHSS
jgi:adenosine deaminase